MEAARRDVVVGLAGIIGTALLPRSGLAQRQGSGATANIMDYGAKGDGSDDGIAFKRAFSAADTVQVPAGRFAVKQIEVPAGKTLVTAGAATVISQLPGQRSKTSLMRIVGSNVNIGAFTAVGNIASDTGEWMHAVEVTASRDTANLSNIIVGDVVGKDIRGDVIYISATPGYAVQGIRIGNVSGDNVYRNVVSIVSGGLTNADIRIASIRGKRVGLYHFDIEPNDGFPPTIGVQVGEIVGRNVGITGPAAQSFADAIVIGLLDLSPDCGGSSPDYPSVGFIRPYGVLVRNTKKLSISSLKARGLAGAAIKIIESSIQNSVSIESCEIAECCQTDTTYHSAIIGGGSNTIINIRQLQVALDQKMTTALLLCANAQIGSINGNLSVARPLINDSSGIQVGLVNMAGPSAVLVTNTTNATFSGGTVKAEKVGYSCDKLKFANMTVEGGFGGLPATQEHYLEKTTLNGTYYESEVYRPSAA